MLPEFERSGLTLDRGLRGRAVIAYLWRDADHFAELPGVRDNDRLTRDVVQTLCRKLGIPGEDFGLDV
jgi:hypothetical protein